MLRCYNSTGCYFFQDCEDHPIDSSPCLGFCVISEWFYKVIWVTVVGTIGSIIACVRCQHCPIHKWLFLGKFCKRRQQIEAGKLAKTSIVRDKKDLQDRIATFQDVVLVRSFSQGKGWYFNLMATLLDTLHWKFYPDLKIFVSDLQLCFISSLNKVWSNFLE